MTNTCPDKYSDLPKDELREFAVTSEFVTVSKIQRHFHCDYPRAARMMDYLIETRLIEPENIYGHKTGRYLPNKSKLSKGQKIDESQSTTQHDLDFSDESGDHDRPDGVEHAGGGS